MEASWKVVSWFLPRIYEGGSSQGQQCRGSVEIVSKETELGLRRRGLARRLMHEKEENEKPRTENRINYVLKTNLQTRAS